MLKPRLRMMMSRTWEFWRLLTNARVCLTDSWNEFLAKGRSAGHIRNRGRTPGAPSPVLWHLSTLLFCVINSCILLGSIHPRKDISFLRDMCMQHWDVAYYFLTVCLLLSNYVHGLSALRFIGPFTCTFLSSFWWSAKSLRVSRITNYTRN